MTQWLTVTLAPQIAIAACLCMVFMAIVARSASSSRRLHNLQSVERQMEAHIQALGEIMDDDRVPLRLREKLLFFSEAIYDHDIFMDLLRTVCDDGRPSWRSRDERKDVLGELNAIDPSLAAAYDVAVTSALMAMLFRHEEAGWLLSDHIARVALDSQKRTIFLQAAQRGQSKFGMGGPPMAAVA